jgi:hypothetical protein
MLKMVVLKKLDGGGDKALEKMVEDASVIGCDLIELLWLTKNGQPRWSIAQIIGFKYPVVGKAGNLLDDVQAESWVDGTVKFYPDVNGRCWGYIFDTKENRELIYSSLSNGWFRIVDKTLREEIMKEASERGFKTEPTSKKEEMIKKTNRELVAEKRAKTLEKELEETKKKLEALVRESLYINNEKMVSVQKRIEGNPLPSNEEMMQKVEKEKENVN